MRVYGEFAQRAFRLHLTYRTATLAGLTTNAFWGALRTFLYLGLFAGVTVEAGWTARDAVDYVWLTQALIMPVYFWGWWEIAQTIRTGEVVTDLTRPVDYYGQWLSRDAGRAAHAIVFRLAPTLLIGVALFGVRLPPDLGRWAAFIVSLLLAIWVSFGLRFLYNIAAFWLLDYRGVGSLVAMTAIFFSGFLIPLNFLPAWLQPIIRWLPFPAMVQTPVEVYLGKLAGADLMVAVAHQVLWAGLLLACGRLCATLALRRVVVHGG